MHDKVEICLEIIKQQIISDYNSKKEACITVGQCDNYSTERKTYSWPLGTCSRKIEQTKGFEFIEAVAFGPLEEHLRERANIKILHWN